MNKLKALKTLRKKIKKSTGDFEPFSERKLHRSIMRAGLNPKISKLISKEIAKEIPPGCTTKEIYKKTVHLIKKKSVIASIHYSLKKSLLDLGPTGYEFEKFIAKYFEAIGYDTDVSSVVEGKFVSHEVDVVAKKKSLLYYVECKFHNKNGHKNDIKIALYVKARWDDLKAGPQGKALTGYYLASNTAFTKDAITFSDGVGLKLLGINAPKERCLLEEIKLHKLYPITSLVRLKKHYKNLLLKKKIILCSELLHEESFLLKNGMTLEEIQLVFSDIKKLLQI